MVTSENYLSKYLSFSTIMSFGYCRLRARTFYRPVVLFGCYFVIKNRHVEAGLMKHFNITELEARFVLKNIPP